MIVNMKRIIYLIFIIAVDAFGQSKSYNCIILDDIFKTLELKKEQIDLFEPMFKRGELKKDGDSIYINIEDTVKIRRIREMLGDVRLNRSSVF
jgi:hypothetical protein